MAKDNSADADLTRALSMANGLMLQALVATHPEPDKLRQAFDTQ